MTGIFQQNPFLSQAPDISWRLSRLYLLATEHMTPNIAGLDVNLSCRAGDVGAPMVLVHRVLLVDIKFKEFIVAITFEILVSSYHKC